MKEQRQHPRLPVEVAAEVELRGETVIASTMNISVGGAGLVTDRPLAEGTKISVTLFLTQDGIEDADETPFEAPATIAWTAVQDAGTWIAGVRFDSVSGEQREQLARFLDKLDPG